MEKLSIRKQLNIIRLYFSGLSYREIAAKAGVSVGAVTNVIADLKAGNYPEVGDVSEQVDLLKELAAEVSDLPQVIVPLLKLQLPIWQPVVSLLEPAVCSRENCEVEPDYIPSPTPLSGS